MTKRMISTLGLLVAIVLMALPNGIAMTFSSGPTEHITKYYSYFSLTPLGYGNWFPLLTAIGAIILIFVMVAFIEKSVKTPLLILASFSLLSQILFGGFTAVGAVVSVLLLLIFVFQFFYKKG